MSFLDMHSLNLTVFYFLNGGAGYYQELDTLMLFVTNYIPYSMVLLVAGYMFWWYHHSSHILSSTVERMIQSIEFAVSLAATWFIGSCIKVLVAYPRPFMTLPQSILLVPDQGGYSFPSMHTALVFAVAVTVMVHHRRLGILLILLALLVGVSRIYIGVHYPIDVLGGIVLGYAIPWTMHHFFDKVRTQ